MSFADKFLEASSEAVHYITCRDKNGADCFFFFTASHMKLNMLKSALHNGHHFDLTRYGKVIYAGFGKKPADSVLRDISEKYNFDAESLVK